MCNSNFEEEALKIYRNKFNDKELFLHLLRGIEKHMDKLRKLEKDRGEVFFREIADVYLLARVLLKLEKVSKENIEKSADYYLKKIKRLFDQ